ncbi:MAG: ATP-grasp domain-containing protein [Candidatus Wallbacteria bacterium]|nr:ATP-grasp domain-containing protein [Candidatus Wallbacteria bacterium]
MKIGITYDLRDEYLAQGFSLEETAEFDKSETIDAIDGKLRSMGFETERIGNVFQLTRALASGKRWDLVFNICEGMNGYGREAQVPALLDAHNIPYTFSDPLVLGMALHKGMTKRVVRDQGVATPDFAVIESPREIAQVNLPFPLFAKPVAEGTSKGITPVSRINNQTELDTTCRMLLKKYRQPIIVETYLPGREFTVGILGSGHDAVAIGIMEVKLNEKAEQGIYSYHNKENYKGLVEYCAVDDEMARKSAKVALASWKAIGGRDVGRVDIRVDAKGEPNFIEVNPLPGMNPANSDLPILARLNGISYDKLIEMIMFVVMRRLKLFRQKAVPATDGMADKLCLLQQMRIPRMRKVKSF